MIRADNHLEATQGYVYVVFRIDAFNKASAECESLRLGNLGI